MKIINNMKEEKIERGNTKLALKSGFWYVFSTFVTKGLAFLTTPIFARLMTSADYGEFSNFANWQSLLLIIVSMEMYNTLSRAYYDFTDEYDQYASSITIIGCFISVAFYIFFLVNSSWIFKFVSIPPQFVHLMFFTMIFQGIKQVYLTKERTLYKYKAVAIISLLSLAVPTIISILLVAKVPEAQRLSARMYGFYVPYALIGVYCAIEIFRNGVVLKAKYIKYAFVLSIPLLAHYLTTYLLASTNTIITKSILGAEAAAVVSITTSIMNIIIVLFQSVTGAVTTWIMDKLEVKQHDLVRKCIVLFAVGAAVIALGIMLVAPEIVKVFGGEKYMEAVSLIPGLAFSVLIQVMTTVLTIILTYDKNIVTTAVATGIVAVVSVGAKILLLPIMGYQALPVVNSLAFILIFVIDCILVCKAGYDRCLNIKAFIVIIVFMALMTFGSFLLYSNTLVRYIVIAICFVAAALIIILTRDKWISKIKRNRRK